MRSLLFNVACIAKSGWRIFLCYGLCAGSALSQNTILYVSATGTNSSPASATSWASSTTNLQGAINQLASSGGGQVWVAIGLYKPDSGNSFSMKNGVGIYGGFMGNEATLSSRPPVNPVMSTPSVTTLAGNGSRLITNSTGLTTTAILDGFVLTGGGRVSLGGAIFNNGSSPTIQNCLLTNNAVSGEYFSYGGAIYNSNGSSPTIQNCLLANNTVTGERLNFGGAIYNSDGSSPTLQNCLLANNTATGNAFSYGGAMANFRNSNPVLTNCSIIGNSTTGSSINCGGAIYNDTSYPILTNCSLQANFVAEGSVNQGGAIYSNSSHIVLTNSICWNNGGSNTFYNNASPIIATYCLFDNSVEGYVGSPTNLTTSTSPFTSTNSTQLAAGSSAINAGSIQAYLAISGPPTDLAENPRFAGMSCEIDLGAYERQEGTAFNPVELATQPAVSSVVCAGETVSISVSAIGSGVLSYQWYKDSIVFPMTTSSLTLTNVQAVDAASYSVVVTGNCNSVTSLAFALTVNDVTSFTINSITVCQGQSVNLTATGCPGGQVIWATGLTSSEITLTAGTSTSTIGATCAIGSCSAIASGRVEIRGLQPPNASIQSLQSDESSCPVRLFGQAFGTAFIVTGPREYVFSQVYRQGKSYAVFAQDLKQPGIYTLKAIYSNECGISTPVSQRVTVNRSCP